MRTTVDIDARVLERAKRHAARDGRTLGAVVSEALGAYLAARPRKADAPFEMIVRGRRGGRFPSAEEIAAVEQEEDLAALAASGGPRRAAP